MQSSGRNRVIWGLVVVSAAALLVPVTEAVAAATRPGTVSPRLVGRWTRTVTKADVNRVTGTSVTAGSTFVLTVLRNGRAIVNSPTFGRNEGTISAAGVSRIHFAIGAPPTATFRWKVTGRRLTLTPASDRNFVDTNVILTGVWTRK